MKSVGRERKSHFYNLNNLSTASTDLARPKPSLSSDNKPATAIVARSESQGAISSTGRAPRTLSKGIPTPVSFGRSCHSSRGASRQCP